MLRVLHLPVNIGNQPWVLSRYERQLGICSDLIVNHGTWLQYPADRYLSTNAGVPTYKDLFVRAFQGIKAALNYDVLHYYFGRSFLGEYTGSFFMRLFADLRLAKLLGKRIFMTLQGCDVRQSDTNSSRNEITMCHLGGCQFAANCRSTLDPMRRRFVAKILPLCDRVFVLNPDLVNDVPNAEFMPYSSVDIQSFRAMPPRTDGLIRILHAPSDESVKGSRHIVEAVERLKARWDIELVLVKGLPYEEALKQYASADLVIDQVLAGWYGGFAVEMMTMAKPVACYMREQDLSHLPARMRSELPLLPISIKTLESDLESILRHRNDWPNWGQQGRDFVFRWHHPRRIAAAMVQCYQQPALPFALKFEQEEVLQCAA